MLVSAKDMALSFGPVESDLFLDSDMPTLYDVFNDLYGEPVKKRKQQRAVSLSSTDVLELEQRIAQSKQSGREFSAVRRRVQRRRSQLSDRESAALLYVVGRTPLHLALETYDRFDGVTWSHGSAEPWKPQLTVVHVLSRGVNLQSLREADGLANTDRQPLYLALPNDLGGVDDELSQDVKRTANRWGAGAGRGWQQVEAIVEHLRREFVHDPDATAPEECTDVVSHFLETGRGADYLFASTAVVMLRSLGYPARLVTGFYARPEKYDSLARQTIVQQDDVHCWAEVCVDGPTWVPIEPTPGYELPHEELTWGQWAANTIRTIALSMWRQPLVTLVLMAVGILAIFYRRELLDRIAWGIWRLGWFGPRRRRVVWTLRWLEWRAWLAGRSRPPTETLPGWYRRFAVGAPSDVGSNLRALLSLADWVLYAPTPLDRMPYAEQEVRETCRQTMNQWTQKRFRCHQL